MVWCGKLKFGVSCPLSIPCCLCRLLVKFTAGTIGGLSSVGRTSNQKMSSNTRPTKSGPISQTFRRGTTAADFCPSFTLTLDNRPESTRLPFYAVIEQSRLPLISFVNKPFAGSGSLARSTSLLLLSWPKCKQSYPQAMMESKSNLNRQNY